jgi:hypothetical protein
MLRCWKNFLALLFFQHYNLVKQKRKEEGMQKILAISLVFTFILLSMVSGFSEEKKSGFNRPLPDANTMRRTNEAMPFKVDVVADAISFYQQYPHRSVVEVQANRAFDIVYEVRNRSNIQVNGATATIKFKLNSRQVKKIDRTINIPPQGREFSERLRGITLETPGHYEVDLIITLPSATYRDTDTQSNTFNGALDVI